MIEPFFFGGSIFSFVFLVILGVILFRIVKSVAEWNHNNKQPILTVNSKVIAKRSKTSRRMHNHGGHHHHHVATDYYATFEVESGDRMELLLTGKEYGQIAEGDVGNLTFQGTRYHDFERIRNIPN